VTNDTFGFLIAIIFHSIYIENLCFFVYIGKGRRGCDRMVVEFTTTCAICANHH